MTPEGILSLVTLPAIVGTLALLAVIVVALLWWFQRRRAAAPPARPAAPPPPLAAPSEYPIDSTQPNRAVNLPPGLYLVAADGQPQPLARLPATIGRSPQSDVVLDGPAVSLAHARIYTDPRLGLCVEDLNTVNGITVDGRPTLKNLLSEGTQLNIGGYEFVFRRVGRSPDLSADTAVGAATVPVPAQTAPLAARGTTQPLPQRPGFGPRPRGAIFADRYQLTEIMGGDGQRQQYLVAEFGDKNGGPAWQCNRCGAVHAQAAPECSICGAPMGSQRPMLTLIETPTTEAQGPAYELAARHLAHGGVRAPLAAFEERVGGAMRYCIVAPATSDMPARPDFGQVLEWSPRLAQALSYLHGAGLSFGGRIGRESFGLVDGRAVWRDFSTAQLNPNGPGPSAAADIRALAQQLFVWLTGQGDSAGDGGLTGTASEVFNRALSGKGYATAADLAGALEQARSADAPARSVDYRTGRKTDVGRSRTLNEDSLFTLERVTNMQSVSRPLGVYVVADGMGGQAAGEVASSTVVNLIAARAVTDLAAGRADGGRPDRLPWLEEVVAAANQKVFDMRQAAGTDMGSTLVLAVVDGDQAFIGHVGDSRIYLINAKGIQRLTVDHSLVERMVAIGQITAQQARTHEQRNVIYRAMGDRAAVEIDTAVHRLAVGDKLLFCSDGLCGPVEDQRIYDIVVRAPDPQAACEALIAAANDAGGPDNITAVLVEIRQV
jgi:serine/threonine protein phosphatase PrpC/pSer/pThr/pTyr-binding forkhead associated (FHA) protein